MDFLLTVIAPIISIIFACGAYDHWSATRRLNKSTSKVVSNPYEHETAEWKIQYQRALLELNYEYPTEDLKEIYNPKALNDPPNFVGGGIVRGSFSTLHAPGLSALINQSLQNRSGLQDMALGTQHDQQHNNQMLAAMMNTKNPYNS